MNRGQELLVALVAVAVLVSGARPGRADSCATRPAAIGPRTVPFGHARQLHSVGAARALLPFRPVVPRTLGRPFRTYVRAGERRFRALGLVYRETDDDWFQLTQSLAGAPRSTYEALARDLARRDPCGSDARLVRLADGSLAVVIAERDRLVIDFRRGRLSLMILGPRRSLSRAEALRIANEVARTA